MPSGFQTSVAEKWCTHMLEIEGRGVGEGVSSTGRELKHRKEGRPRAPREKEGEWVAEAAHAG